MPSKKLWAYIAKLEKVIKSTMESSEEISDLVEKIQGEGVEVSLNCIALFSDPNGKSFTGPEAERAARAAAAAASAAARKLRKLKGKKPTAKGEKKAPRARKKPADFKVTDADREFLKQIGIKFDE
jgi:class 3 adenylate cyclase